MDLLIKGVEDRQDNSKVKVMVTVDVFLLIALSNVGNQENYTARLPTRHPDR